MILHQYTLQARYVDGTFQCNNPEFICRVVEVKRVVASTVIGFVAVVGGSIGPAVAEPSTETQGCQTVATKYLQEDAPGHEGIQNAAGQESPGEGPCGFGTPPGH